MVKKIAYYNFIIWGNTITSSSTPTNATNSTNPTNELAKNGNNLEKKENTLTSSVNSNIVDSNVNTTSTNTTTTNFSKNYQFDFGTTVTISNFFITFSIYFYNQDFFQSLESQFESKKIISLKELIDSKIFSKCYIKEENIYECLIACDERLTNDYNLNTVNTLEDVKEIIDKYQDAIVTFNQLLVKILKNHNYIKSFFSISDEVINTYESIISTD